MSEKQKVSQKAVKGLFRPTAERLREIGKKGMEEMENLRSEDIERFSEVPAPEKPN